jgi:Domain of unknown function (DUF4407)
MQPNGGRKRRPGAGTRLFLWCAGADGDLLAALPRFETVKQAGFGTLVVVPALLALFAMTYALSTVSARPLIYGGGGLLWAVIVFSFDRFLVSTFRKSGSVARDVTSAVFLSRVLLAGFVGMIVAHPLVMLYFADSIDERLDVELRAKVAALAAVHAEERSALIGRIGALEEQTARSQQVRDRHQAQLIDEIDGVVSGRTTGIAGRGASAAEKKLQLERAQRELTQVRARNSEAIGALRSELGALEGEQRQSEEAFHQARDYLARVGALETLAAQSPHVDRLQWFLVLFFVFVDTLPILFKGLTPAGPYDEWLRLSELEAAQTVRSRRLELLRGRGASAG